jgi:acetyl esterase/lipase
MDVLATPPPPPDARIPYGAHASQFGDLRLPPGPGPHKVAVLVHGGFWRAQYDLAHLGHLAAALTAIGFATWNVEYRRVGEQSGGWPNTFLDVARACDHVRELAARLPLDLTRVMAVGHSAGGHLAVWLAARWRIPAGDSLHTADPLRLAGAVSLAGAIDLRRVSQLGLSNGAVYGLMGGSAASLPDRYRTASPPDLLPLAVSQVLVHGTDDEEVPYDLSRDYAERARARGDHVELVTLPGEGHFALIDPESQVWPTIAGTIQRAFG